MSFSGSGSGFAGCSNKSIHQEVVVSDDCRQRDPISQMESLCLVRDTADVKAVAIDNLNCLQVKRYLIKRFVFECR